tara:strand:+ start:3266 stop:4282 length:1017 start_codon:yes stop_codon:yes gene_type:complete
MKKILITGVTGQDGAYLSRFLIDKNYKVFGAVRRTSSLNYWRLNFLNLLEEKNFELVDLDITDQISCYEVIKRILPDQIYNLAAQSFVKTSFSQPNLTAEVTGIGALNILNSIKSINPEIRFYQASSSEMFGKVVEIPQKETTPFYPRSPYAVAKLFAHWSTINYRESYDLYAVSGILFNHESPLRGIEFVTRKISNFTAMYSKGLVDKLEIGNMDSKRDWGYAKEYVEGMYLMLNQEKPDDYVLATGETHSVRKFIEICFEKIGKKIEWSGEGIEEFGIDVSNGKKIIEINPQFFRPAEVDLLVGDPSKALKKLNWKSTTNIEELAEIMVSSDLNLT